MFTITGLYPRTTIRIKIWAISNEKLPGMFSDFFTAETSPSEGKELYTY